MSLDHLSPDHLVGLTTVIDPDVISERGYFTAGMESPLTTEIHDLGIEWKIRRGSDGLIIPVFGPSGALVSAQFRFDEPQKDAKGKTLRYVNPTGIPNKLDVHPRNINKVRDIRQRLWITEGIKKGDALTSRGELVVTISGVFTWRDKLGTLGEWEEIPLRDRQVIICFDSDAKINRQVQLAMKRLGRWLRSKRADVLYLITPEAEGFNKTGVDDYLSTGASIDDLLKAGTEEEPGRTADGTFSDSYLAETVAEEVLEGEFVWSAGLGWMEWTGNRWKSCPDESLIESVRKWAVVKFADAIKTGSDGTNRTRSEVIDGWRSVLSRGRLTAITSLTRGIVKRDTEDFDAHSHLINTPSGVVNLETGEISEPDPDLLMTKITRGAYRPGFRHADWDQALLAIPEELRNWFQSRVGQSITGKPTPDGVLVVLQGSGENGKSAVSTDALVPALGDYAGMASAKLLSASKGNEHSTEIADLRGQRLMIAEELTEGRSLNVVVLKRIMDVGRIKARFIRKDNIEFDASHSLFLTTNYIPVINETDHGTWRRLALMRFPYRFRKRGEELEHENDRRGDERLKDRIRDSKSGQHDAIVTWAIEGSLAYHQDPSSFRKPSRVLSDTDTWRATADRILGFWREVITPDPESHMWVNDLLEVFNNWISENGHTEWSKETFTPRFEQHSETAKHGTHKRKIRADQKGVGSLARPPKTGSVPARYDAWMKVRLRNQLEGSAMDDTHTDLGFGTDDPQNGTSGTTTSDDHQVVAQREGNKKGSCHSCQNGSEDHELHDRQTSQTLVFDLETAGVGRTIFDYGEGFIRLGAYMNGDGPLIVPISEIVRAVRDPKYVITGHNITGFDLIALAHHHGLELRDLLGRVADTDLLARLEDPPMSGKDGASHMPKGYYSLNEINKRKGLPSKTDELPRMAKLYGGFDKIPVDDPEYRSYLEGDVRASAALYAALPALDAYAVRENNIGLITAQMTVNGCRVDVEEIARTLAEQADRKEHAKTTLNRIAGMPLNKVTSYKTKPDKVEPYASPLATKAGKDAIVNALMECGIPEEAFPRTLKTQEISMSGDLKQSINDYHKTHKFTIKDRVRASEIIDLVQLLVGERTIYQTAEDCRVGDRVHPEIRPYQSSGRWSVTKPGLTVFGKRGGRHVERRIILPEPGHNILTVDLAQGDMRGVAGHSGDEAYLDIFLTPGPDGKPRDLHAEVAKAVFGTEKMREAAKAIGHGWNYGESVNRMVINGIDRDLAIKYDQEMRRKYPKLVEWQNNVRSVGEEGRLLDNGFGRLMRADPRFAYTQAPALVGQGCTRDMLAEGLLRLPLEFWPYLRVIVHDEIVMSVPAERFEEIAEEVVRCMSFDLGEATGGRLSSLPIVAEANKPGALTWAAAYDK